MGVALVHGPVTVYGVLLSALVAGDDARGYVQRAHQHHEGRGDVLAKALFAVKPELVGGVRAIQAGLQRVAVTAAAQSPQGVIDEGLGAASGEPGVGLHLPRQGQGARVQLGRQLHIGLHLRRAPLRAVGEAQVALGAVAQHAVDGAGGAPL